MTIPYTYVINCPDGRRYYGVRFAKNCKPEDLWVSYFTSSNHIQQLIKLYGKEAFTFQVRKTFANKEEACDWEHKVLQRLRVNRNEAWVNVTSSRSRPSMEGNKNPSKRPEVREKISKAKTGKPRPDSSKRMKENHPLRDPEARKKLSESMKRGFADGTIVSWSKGKKRPEMTGENHPRWGKEAAFLGDINKIEYTCDVCGKVGKGPGMKRYHF